MPARTQFQNGLLWDQAAEFAQGLAAMEQTQATALLSAWSESYWQVRAEMDAFLEKVATAQAAGLPTSPAWAYQQQRLKGLLDTTKVQMARYAEHAAELTTAAQKSAVAAGVKHAEKLAKTAVAQGLPGLDATFVQVNPKVLESGVGFLADGSVLSTHLAATLPAQAAEGVRSAITRGLATGKSPAWMIREMTKAYGVPHSRAVNIARTETMRAYRHASRAEMMANADTLEGWVWHAALDARTCSACAVMDGTVHPLDATLDGHPQCRCAMVPRTQSWEDILGPAGKDLPDTRPPIRSGKDWLASQPAHVQRAILGPGKFGAYKAGTITLDDLVARSFSPTWGTMRRERSLKAILEDRDANYFDAPATPPQVGPAPLPDPDPALVARYLEHYDEDYLEDFLATPGNSPKVKASIQAALGLKKVQAGRHGPYLPRPDLAKVDAAVEKLRQAVLTKGYPSKGYSQTQAIYKAQANGTPGTKVGVVKSLTWEQKITAQAILDKHADDLPALVRQADKAKALKAAQAEAIRVNKVYDAQTEANAIQAAMKEAEAIEKAADEAYLAMIQKSKNDLLNDLQANPEMDLDAWWQVKALDADDAVKAAGDDALAKAVADAQRKALMAARASVKEAQDSIQANGWSGTTWTAKSTGGTLHVYPNGVAKYALTPDDADALVLAPGNTWKALTNPDQYTQVLVPDDVQVDVWKSHLLDDEGYVDPGFYKDLQQQADPDFSASPLTLQEKTDLQEALDQTAANHAVWKPDAEHVTYLKAGLDNGNLTVEDLTKSLTDKYVTDPADVATLKHAITEWQAEQIAKASIPVPKPVIDVTKVKWDKVSDVQVGKLKAKVGSGELTVDDLYAKYQASKNAGPKANYAKAILELEGKGDTIPKPAPDLTPEAQHWADTWEADLKAGTISEQDLKDVVDSPFSSGTDVAAAKHVLAKGIKTTKGPDVVPDAAPPAPTPPAPQNGPSWPTKPPWEVEDLKDTGVTLGTHSARVMEAPDGTRWLFKPPKSASDTFLATVDEAASRLQARAGLRAPDTYVVTIGGKRGSIQRMFPSSDGFPNGFRPGELSEADLGLVQREHALDWLIGNHDGHRDQFLRLQDGTMVGIDKGQAFRWFGQDRLDWDFHPNSAYGAPEPVYNALWRAFANGDPNVDLDPPGSGPLWDQVKALQAIPDDELRDLFRGYAEQAAARGLLAKRQQFPGLKASSIPENDVEAFLDALVARKNAMGDDFTRLYEKAAAQRRQALPGWTPKAAKPVASGSKAKWVGKDKPAPPEAPAKPEAETATLFDTWLDEARARYSAFAGPGKTLDASNNWARFRRVIDDLDESALDELAARSYLDDDAVARGRALITEAKAKRAALQAEYDVKMAAHKRAQDAWKKDLADWMEANGIKDLTQGMDDAVLRHTSDQKGVTWAQSKFSETKYTAAQRRALKSYTGPSYASWNRHLRDTEGNPTEYLTSIRAIDKAMDAQPIPEDVILHRGTSVDSFVLDGARLPAYGDTDLTKLIGSVQKDEAYMSTSVGNSAAFAHQPVQLKIRAPAGTPGSYVQMFSQYQHERELILGRGTRFYVHNAYKSGGKWVLEVEVVPRDFDPTQATPKPSRTPWSL